MAKRHGLETVALLAAVSACSSGNRVDSPAAPPVSPAIFEDIREDIESLQSIQDVCEASGAGTVLCTRQNGNNDWTFTAVPKGEKLLVINGEAEEVDWNLRVEGSCTNDMAGVVLTGQPPLPNGGERFLGNFVTTIHGALPCALPISIQAEYGEHYETNLKELIEVVHPHEQAMGGEVQRCLDEGEKTLAKFVERGVPEATDTVCNTSYGPVQFTYTVGLGEEGKKDRLLELDFKDAQYHPHIRISNDGWEFSIRLETGASASIVSKNLKELSTAEKSLLSFLDTLSLAPVPAVEYLWLADIHPWGEIFPPDISLMQKVHTYQATVITEWLEEHPNQSFGVVLENLPRAWAITGADWVMADPNTKERYRHLAPLAEKYKARLHFTGTDTDADVHIALEQTEALIRLGTELKEKGCLNEKDAKKYKENIAGVMDRWTTAAQREVTTAIQFSRGYELGGVALISGLYHGPETKEKLSGVKIHVAPGLPSMTDRPEFTPPPLCPAPAELQVKSEAP